MDNDLANAENGYPAGLMSNLRKTYYDESSPQNFASAKTLKRAFPKLSNRDIANFLMGQRAHTEFVPTKKFTRRLTIKKGVYETVQSDLSDYQAFRSYNGSFSYLFVCICIFSKKLFLTPVKTKGTKDMLEAFSKFFAQVPSQYSVKHVHTDQGQEYMSCKDELKKKYNVNLYYTKSKSPHKAAIAERTIQTVDKRVYKLMEVESNLKWTKYVPAVQSSFNNTWHRGLPKNTSPNDVVAKKKLAILTKKKFAEDVIAHNQKIEKADNRRRKRGVDEVRVGDSVRLIRDKGTFTKGHVPTYSKEIHKISKIKETTPRMYFVGATGNRGYYRAQIVKVANDAGIAEDAKTYFIASTRRVGGKTLRSGLVVDKETEYLVRARNDPSFSHWLSEGELATLRKKTDLDDSILNDTKQKSNEA